MKTSTSNEPPVPTSHNNKHIKEGIITGLLIFLVIFLGIISGLVLKGYLHSYYYTYVSKFLEDHGIKCVVYPLLFIMPLVISIILGKSYLNKEYSKKLFYKMPLYSIFPSFIAMIIGIWFYFATESHYCSGGPCGIEVILAPLGIVIVAIISYFLANYYYYTKEMPKVGKTITYLAIAVIIAESILAIVFYFLLISISQSL
ncbi:MAG: hypothetical protein V1734_03810 [Nanoarchaeota archaeon]